MRRAALTLVLSVLLAPIAGYTAARWFALHGPGRAPATSPADASASAPQQQPAAAVTAAPEPVFVGNTWDLAAEDVDATVGIPTNRALIALARHYIGTPYNAFSLDRHGREQLRLDLTRFDCFLFVEQLLALVNSREVTTKSEAVRNFTDHVTRLRYEKGRVDYCHRHHYFSRWAEEAERKGYLVNITRFLPGAESRRRPLTFMSSHAEVYEPMRQPANRRCILEREKSLVVQQPYIPLEKLPDALSALREGDIFGLVTRVPGLDVTHVGLVERSGGAVDAIHAAEGSGVIRSRDLVNYASNVKDVIGVMILRPIPNPDGRLGS